MAGLINTAINKDDPLKSISGYEAFTSDVNEPTDTVQGQMSSLLASDSPYLTQARTRADQQMNRRGLLNSSMAVGASESAAYDAALPIASQDANIFNTTRLTNQAARNRGMEFTAGAQNTGALQALQGNQNMALQQLQGTQALENIAASGTQQRLTDAQRAAAESQLLAQRGEIDKQLLTATGEQRTALLAQQAQIDTQMQLLRGTQAMQLQELKASQDLAMQGLRGEQAQQLATIEGTYRELIQTSASAASIYSNLTRSISDILSNPELDGTSKQTAINSMIDVLEGGLAVLSGISGLDLNSLLSF